MLRHLYRLAQLTFLAALTLIPSPLWTPLPAGATERLVQVEGAKALLDVPASPRGTLILLPGRDGDLGLTPEGLITNLVGNQLVRTRHFYSALGFAVLTVDASMTADLAMRQIRGLPRPIAIVATSRGALRAPPFFDFGPDALVITSGLLDAMKEQVVTPDRLPPTLIVHHRNDTCHRTLPASAKRFAAWSNGRAQLLWLSGGESSGAPCGANSHHGFSGLDEKVVAAVAAFVTHQK